MRACHACQSHLHLNKIPYETIYKSILLGILGLEAQSSAITYGETRCTYLPTTVGLLGSDNITSKLFQFPYISSVFTSISTYKCSTQYPLWIWKQDEEIISNKKVNKPQQGSCNGKLGHIEALSHIHFHAP